MSTQQDDDSQEKAVVWAILIGVILLAVSLAIGFGLSRSWAANNAHKGYEVPVTQLEVTEEVVAVEQAPAPAPVAPEVSSNEANVVVENGVVKFYFATGKSELASGAKEALEDIIKGVATGKKAVISGFHDSTGSLARNQELAKERALAVKSALVELGVSEDKLDLRKPETTTATGSNAEARRVEVTLE